MLTRPISGFFCHTFSVSFAIHSVFLRQPGFVWQKVFVAGHTAISKQGLYLIGLVKDFLIQFTEYSKIDTAKAGGQTAPGLLMLCLLVSHHLADFFAEHTLDFVFHRFGAGFTEMRPHKVSGLADFLHHRGRGVWLGPGEGHACGSVGKFVCHRLSFQSIRFFKRASLSCAVALRKFSPEKRMGAHISSKRS